MMEQHTTLSLAFLSQTGPDGKAEGTAHPTPEKKASEQLWFILDAVTISVGRENLWEKGRGKQGSHQCSWRLLWQHLCWIWKRSQCRV